MGTIIDKLKLTLGTKNAIREAIISMGQAVPETLKFSGYPEKIRAIRTGVETGDATAGAGDILSGKTAYVKGQKVTGTIQSQGAKVITPGTTAQTAVAKGMFTSGAVTVQGDANLKAENIKSGVKLFGISGSCPSTETATVTITSTAPFGIDINYTNENNTFKFDYIEANSSLTITVNRNSLIAFWSSRFSASNYYFGVYGFPDGLGVLSGGSRGVTSNTYNGNPPAIVAYVSGTTGPYSITIYGEKL